MIKNIEIIGHRGVRSEEPDNTLPSYQKAISYRVDYIDIDVVLTKDKNILAYHDYFINPDILCYADNTNISDTKESFLNKFKKADFSNVLIKNFNFDDIINQYNVKLNKYSQYAKYFNMQQQHDNLKLSSLADIVLYTQKESNYDIKYQIEIKSNLDNPDWSFPYQITTEVIYNFLLKYNLIEKVKIQSFDWRILYSLTLKNNDIKTAYLFSRNTVDMWYNWFSNSPILEQLKILKLVKTATLSDLLLLIKSLGAYSFEIEDNILKLENVLDAHKLGLKVYTWPLPESSNKPYDENLMKKIIKFGVNGIITDYPKQLSELLISLDI